MDTFRYSAGRKRYGIGDASDFSYGEEYEFDTLEDMIEAYLRGVISRGDQNTRPRDYYDIFILAELQSGNIDQDTIRDAFRATNEKRGSGEVVKHYREIMQVVRNSSVMNRQWNDYRKDFDYAAEIDFGETCDAVIAIMDRITE